MTDRHIEMLRMQVDAASKALARAPTPEYLQAARDIVSICERLGLALVRRERKLTERRP